MLIRFRGGGDKVTEDEDKEIRVGAMWIMKPLRMVAGTGVEWKALHHAKTFNQEDRRWFKDVSLRGTGILHRVLKWY